MDFAMLKQYLDYGIVATLFLWLFFYNVRKNEEREQAYRDIIKELSESFRCLSEDVCQIKEKIDNFMR
jgi:hypothetical protein